MSIAPSEALHASGIEHRYGQHAALSDITFSLPAGTRCGLIGPDGAGKSSLLGLIAGVKNFSTANWTCWVHRSMIDAIAIRSIDALPSCLKGWEATFTLICRYARTFGFSARCSGYRGPNATNA